MPRGSRPASNKARGSAARAEVDHAFGLLEDGRHADAIAAFESAVARAPDDGVAWIGLGKAYRKIEDHDQALRAFGRAAALRPRSEFASLCVFHSALRARRYEDAKREARRFLALQTPRRTKCKEETRKLYEDWANDDDLSLERAWDQHTYGSDNL